MQVSDPSWLYDSLILHAERALRDAIVLLRVS